jgi:hypothetical protein
MNQFETEGPTLHEALTALAIVLAVVLILWATYC